ncbi:MAG: hypothetical protein DMG36_15060 [Acidobacteria bacterium]|nr:MAG: hypothetical protein DMG36_15060 [Acidobacteriota bacterium]
MDINWKDKTISIRFKTQFGFKPKDYEERTIAVSDTRNAMSTAPESMRRTGFLWSLLPHHFFVEPPSHEASLVSIRRRKEFDSIQ